MYQVSPSEFEVIVSQAIDAIPEKYFKHITNVAFVVEDQPTVDQRKKLDLRGDQLLLGLYEGIPITRRSSGYNLVLPDKITLFKDALEIVSNSAAELHAQVKETVWHEVAHYFGLDHLQIHELEQ